MSASLGKSNLFVIGIWSGTVFGLLEGIVLCASRAHPTIQAAHKVSNDALCVAPLFDIPLFLLATLPLLLAFSLLEGYVRGRETLTAFGYFSFLGILTVITMPKVIHTFAAVILSLGLATALVRILHGSETTLAIFLRRRVLWIPIILSIAALCTWGLQYAEEYLAARALPPAPSNATSVLVIVLDTVRADHYARPAGESLVPNLNALSARGVQFTNAWSTSSWSLPSQASILTGLYPHEHGADWPTLRLDNRVPTLQEFFARRGYITGAFSGNAAWITPEYLGKGFLRFQVYLFEDLLRRTVHGRKLDRVLDEVGYHSAGRGKKAPEVVQEFLKFIDDYPNRPFFSYLCFMDVNQAEHDRKFNHEDKGHAPVSAVVSSYDLALSDLDKQLAQLFAALQQRGRWQNTLLIVTSDHGISFSKQNPGDHDPADHGTSLYREQSEVPLFVAWSGKLTPGLRVAQAVSVRQIPATIADLLKVNDSPFSGDPLPFVSKLLHDTEDLDPCSAAELRDLDGKLIDEAIFCAHWQYIRHAKPKNQAPEELFDFNADPSTSKNLAGNPDVQPLIAQMRIRLAQLTKAAATPSDNSLAAIIDGGRAQ